MVVGYKLMRRVCVMVLVCSAVATGVTLYVAPDGSDDWSGHLPRVNADRADGPLASLAGARDAIRAGRGAGRLGADVTVSIRAGTYRLTEPFVLAPQDSGVTYAAYPGEAPVFSGGRTIGGWEPGTSGRWTARVPGVAEGEWFFRQLFVNGRRRTRARTPNTGQFHTILRKAPPRVDPASGRETLQDREAFVFSPGDIRSWSSITEVNVVVYHSWETSRLRIAEVDVGQSLVRFTGPACWPFERWGHGQRYYVENHQEFLDAPGEWFLDRSTGVVSYLPMPGEDMATAEVVAPYLKRLVELRGAPNIGLYVEGVILRGLTFRHEDWELEPDGHSDGQAAVTVPAAVMADGASGCVIDSCEIAQVGHYGVWFRRGCRSNRVIRSRIHDLGVGGVRIGEAAEPRADAIASSRNVVDNNHIYDGGHVYAAGVGVWVAQSHRNTVSHNEIHDFNYSGMSIGWNWNDAQNRCHDNVIEYNHVHHVMSNQLNDGGAIYTLGASPGSVIRHNLFHDVWPFSAIGWGIYLDATTSGYLVENNIVYNTLSGGLMKHNGGHENVIRNNVFAFSALQMLWPCWSVRPNTFERNIVYLTQGDLFIPMAERRLRERLASAESLGTWNHNVYWRTGDEPLRFFEHDFAEWQSMGLDTDSVIADPQFADAGSYDFRLRPASPALKLGFRPIDTSGVGLYGDPEWIAEARAVRHPPAVLPQPPPPPAPQPVVDGFEGTITGVSPQDAVVSGEDSGASIRVSTERAATGRHSLKVVDSPGAQPEWQPHFFYQPRFREGMIRQSFDILLEPGALLYTEWRDRTQYPDCIGPSLTLDAQSGPTARVLVSGQQVASFPVAEWLHVDIDCKLGQGADGEYAVSLTSAAGARQRFDGIRYTGAAFKELHWLGFVSTAVQEAVFFVDNVKITVTAP